MSSKPTTSGLVCISAMIPARQRAALCAIGEGNLSLGLRRALAIPPTTSSGALWVQSACLLPDPATADGPGVIACPDGVVAHGCTPSALVLDAAAGTTVFTAGDGSPDISTELSISALAALAGRLTGAVLACCDGRSPADEFGHDLPAGLHISRLAPGLVRIAASGASGSVVLPIRTALQLAAEVASLFARRFALHQQAVVELNNTLAGSQPVEQEAQP